MDDCRVLAKQGAPEGTVVSANFQGRGRGRFKRTWVSPPGENIQISVLVRPRLSHLCYLNMAATLAISETALMITSHINDIKWPNDVQINGKKLSGILIESEISGSIVDFAIIGIGLNVNLDPGEHLEISGTSTSLKEVAGTTISRSYTLHFLLERLDFYYRQILEGKSLTSQWQSKINTIGKEITLSFPEAGKEQIKGTANSINEDGSLVVKKSDGSIFNAVAGEVALQE